MCSDQKSSNADSQKYDWGLLAILGFGVFVFFWAIGIEVLHPENIGWLKGMDSLQHYLGWSFFRFSSWTIPIGLNPNYGLGISSSIVFSDSIPLLAVFLKFFSNYLPQVFQYFGFWLFACFVLQAYFAWKLVGLITNIRFIRFIAATFFVISPPLVWRVLGVNLVAGIGPHVALASHFLILAGLYLSLRPYEKNTDRCWLALLSISLLIHFYIFFMVGVLFFGGLLDEFFVRKNKSPRSSIQVFFLSLVSIIFLGWLFGYFVGGASLSAIGYGFYRLPLFAFFDPMGWSRTLPAVPMNLGISSRLGVAFSSGSYEGYSYLGLGGLCILIISVAISFFAKSSARKTLRKSPFFLLALIFLFLLALTNNIGVGTKNYYLDLPQNILNTLDIVRNSGRLVWPVFYFTLFIALWILIKNLSSRAASIILVLCLAMQILDLQPAISLNKQKLIADSSFRYQNPLKSEFWEVAATHYQQIVEYPLIQSQWQPNWEAFSRYASEHRMATNAVYLARADTKKIAIANQDLLQQIQRGPLNPGTLYILGSWKEMPHLPIRFDPRFDLLANIDGFTVLAPGWRNCKSCESYKVDSLRSFVPEIQKGESISFARGTGNADIFLLDSWAHPEGWGVWTTGEIARILLPIPNGRPSKINLLFDAFVGGKHPHLDIELLGDRIPKLIRLNQSHGNVVDILIPQAAKDVGYIEIAIKVINPMSPKSLGISDDERSLGVGLVSAMFK